jgi:pSer/pThr/pTyr-binding forkhead associated (FHA) protein
MPELIIKLGDREVNRVAFTQDIINIGRTEDNEVVIPNLGVSRQHAQIRKEKDKFIVTDLNSTNGTYLNEERVISKELQHGDLIKIGKHTITFENSEAVKAKYSWGASSNMGSTIMMDNPAQEETSQKKDKFIASIMAPSFHTGACDWVKAISDKRKIYFSTREDAIESGRKPCKLCKP